MRPCLRSPVDEGSDKGSILTAKPLEWIRIKRQLDADESLQELADPNMRDSPGQRLSKVLRLEDAIRAMGPMLGTADGRSLAAAALASPAFETKAIKKVSGTTKLDLAQFREKQAFAQFGSDLDDDTKAQLERGQRIVELFKQNQYSPQALEIQVATLFAMQNGYVDDVPVDKVKDFQAKMEEFLTTRKEAVMAKIREQQALSDEIVDELKSAIEDFKSTYNA